MPGAPIEFMTNEKKKEIFVHNLILHGYVT